MISRYESTLGSRPITIANTSEAFYINMLDREVKAISCYDGTPGCSRITIANKSEASYVTIIIRKYRPSKTVS